VLAALPLLALLSQAEAAPEPPPTPSALPAPRAPEPPPPPLPPTTLALSLGGGWRLPPASRDVPPSLGLAIGTFASYRYALLRERLELSVAASFSYQRYARSLGAAVGPVGSGDRTYSSGDFVIMQTAAVQLGRLRPWLAAGAGVSLGFFTSAEDPSQPSEQRTTVVLVQGSAGTDLALHEDSYAGLRADLGVPLARPLLKGGLLDGKRVLGPRLSLQVVFGYRF
jgi:hypothetical protein